jgi:hypothetical protein
MVYHFSPDAHVFLTTSDDGQRDVVTVRTDDMSMMLSFAIETFRELMDQADKKIEG